MNHPYGSTVNAAGKKETRSSAARALVVGLVLAFSGAAAWAIGSPIPGIDIVVRCDGCRPPVHGIMASTNSKGDVAFKDLALGEYDLSIAGQHVQTITVGANRSITGVLSREPDGTARISVSGQSRLVPLAMTAFEDLAKKHESRTKQLDNKQQPGISDQSAAGGFISYGTAPPPKAGDGKLPDLATVKPIAGTEVGLEHDPERTKFSTMTDENGAFQFTKLPAGKYKVAISDVGANRVSEAYLAKVTVGPDGIFGGTVMRGSDDKMSIFDRRGNLISIFSSAELTVLPGKPVAKKPDTGFGSVNTMGGFPGGPGAMVPPVGPMSPGAGPMSPGPGGPGGAMRPGAGKP